MKNIFHLMRKDLIRFLNDKPGMLLTFVVPAVLIIIFGNIFSGGGERGKTPVILCNESNSKIATYFERSLDSSRSIYIVKEYQDETTKKTVKFDEEKAKQYVKDGKISAAVVLPIDFFADTSSALKFKFYFDPKSEIESAIIQGSIQQLIFSQMPTLMPVLLKQHVINFLGESSATQFKEQLSGIMNKYFEVQLDSVIPSISKLEEQFADTAAVSDKSGSANFMNNLVKFEKVQLVGTEIKNPGVTRIVGGWAMMFLLFSLTGAATSLFEEKQEGSLKRLLCMPIKKSEIMWSKYIYSILLGVFQLFIMFILSWLFYDVDIFSNFFNLFIVILASSAAAVSFGMLITALTKTLAQANGIATLLILVMSALGGSWFPVTLLPDWIQIISKFTLTYWSIEAFLQVLWRQSDFGAIAQHVFILLSIAFVTNFYALIKFRKGEIF
ncbi:MAG: ABC transporter permease [bacterium]